MDHDLPEDELPAWQQRLLQQHQLPPAYLASAQYWFDPLVDYLCSHQLGVHRPIVVGINGSQGSGKSTLCAYLEMAMAAKYGFQVVTLSLDDFYHTREYRTRLSQDVHPLLATRGVPGTHDMSLLEQTIDALVDDSQLAPVAVTRFDKARDDRRVEPESVMAPVDIVLLEGWCLGVQPQSVDAVLAPVNELERSEDPDGIWRKYVNNALSGDFVSLNRRVDRWVMLQAPGFGCVHQWRSEQEQKLARAQGTNVGKRLMDEAQLSRFIMFFQRLTELALDQLPERVDYLFELDESRKIRAAHQPTG